MSTPTPLAVYVHIPFCARHCAYCDFNTYIEKAQSAIVGATVDAICADIAQMAGCSALAARPVRTVFFGGGTPTFLSGRQLARMLDTLRAHFCVERDAEISSEANPGTSDAGRFAEMRAAGFNRLSIGVQSFNDSLLTALDRFHSADEAVRAYHTARNAGFANVNLDLMFGLPKQNAVLWEDSLRRAVALGAEHLSLYALTLEPGTRFERLHAGGKLDLPDEDAEADMYERCIELVTSAGYEHYEISNFAQPGFRCRHNATYWRNEEYLGFGPGAVSYIAGRRWKKEKLPKRYVEKVAAALDLAVEEECLGSEAALGETMMLGLRLLHGLPIQRVRDRFGAAAVSALEPTFARLLQQGLLTREEDILRLTRTGLMLENTIAAEFLAPGTQ